jgi:AcrR family transcriptional regulator
VPTATGLARRLHKLVPVPLPSPIRARPSAHDKILDAALVRFAESGVGGTTMSQLARDAGISREWLYKHFPNRDAIAIAVSRREVERLIDGLAASAVGSEDVESSLTEAFAYAVEFLRAHALLQQVIRNEPAAFASLLHDQGDTVVATAVDVSVEYIQAISPIKRAQAVVIAETLVRLVIAITVAPYGRLDLDDPAELRTFGRSVVCGLLAAG